MRAMVFVLVAANLLFFALTRDWLAPFVTLSAAHEREPQRLTQQVDPGALRVLPVSAAGSAVAAASAAASAANTASAAER
jgi:predicted ribosome-associated RNA-binding protein Tma20